MPTSKSIESLAKRFMKQRHLQIMVIPWIIWIIVFCYIPMYGLIIAFNDYQFGSGIFGSPWVGLKNFEMFLNDPKFWNIMRNTLGINIYKLIFCFPAPIIFALLLNEIKNQRFKKIVQSVSYLPHFISWPIFAGMLIKFMSTDSGLINDLLVKLRILDKPVMFLGEPQYFWSILVLSDIWKSIGWGSIIYLAAISSIDQEMYEAAIIDGATAWQRAVGITIPSIVPTIVILLILTIGSLLNSSFDQTYLLQNPIVLNVGEVIDTYAYKVGLSQGRYSYSTAVGLFKSVIALIMIVIANKISNRTTELGIW